MTDGCSDLKRDTDIAHGRLPVRKATKISALPADIPQCVADSLTEGELILFVELSRYYGDMGKRVAKMITRLCEVAEQKDKAHRRVVDEAWTMSQRIERLEEGIKP